MLATFTDRMAMAYRECARWADGEPFGVTDDAPWSDEAMRQSEADCDDFLALCEGQGVSLADWDAVQLGRNLWLSRNGHGAGFFDSGTPDADQLQALARSMGTSYFYLADNGEVFFGG